jgi:hypothetical protein
MDWIEEARDKVQWRTLLNETSVSLKADNFVVGWLAIAY